MENLGKILGKILQKKDDKVIILKKIPLPKSYKKGWYDISSLDRNIKYIFYPGKPDIHPHLSKYELNAKYEKDTINKNLSFIASLIQETGKETNAIYKEELKEKNIFYRSDGSIFYNIESKAYERICEMTLFTKNEEMGVITPNGVFVLPSWANDSHEAYHNQFYAYIFKDGKLIDHVLGKTINIDATVHTHPNGGDMSGDGFFARYATPGKPMFALMMEDGGSNKKDEICYILHSGVKDGDVTIGTITKGNSAYNVSNLKSGGFCLRAFAKRFRNWHYQTGTFKTYPSFPY